MIGKQYIPVGGIGTGFLQIGEEGQIINFVPESRLYAQLLPNTFPCVRLQFPSGKIYSRILYCSQEREPKHPLRPPVLLPCQLRSVFHYPIVSFQLSDTACPIRITWTYFCSFIPYDSIAAGLPFVALGIRLENVTDMPINASALFCLDNIAKSFSQEQVCGPVHTIKLYSETESAVTLNTVSRRGFYYEIPHDELGRYGFNALLLGDRRVGSENKPESLHGCLAVGEVKGAKIQVSAFDPNNVQSTGRFWGQFIRKTAIPFPGITNHLPVCAVMISNTLNSKQTQRYDFVFAWHHRLRSLDQPETLGYQTAFKDAQFITRHVFKHLIYMFSAVEKWQQPLENLMFAPKFGKALIDCTSAFTAHTRFSARGLTFISRQVPDEEDFAWEFETGIALLTFVPSYHTACIKYHLEKLVQEKSLSLKTLRSIAELFLSVYVNIYSLGHRARILEWLPLINNIITKLFPAAWPEGNWSKSFSLVEKGIWAIALQSVRLLADEVGESRISCHFKKLSEFFYDDYHQSLNQLMRLSSSENNTHEKVHEALDALSPAYFSRLANITLPKKIQEVVLALWNVTLVQNLPTLDFQAKQKLLLFQLLFLQTNTSEAVDRLEMLIDELGDIYFQKKLEETPHDPSTKRGLSNLSLWCILLGLSGFSYDALQQHVLLRISIISRQHVRIPIFSSVALGDITVNRDIKNEQCIQVGFRLEAPITIRSLRLEIPKAQTITSVSFLVDKETIDMKYEITHDLVTTHIEMYFRTPLKLARVFKIKIEGNVPENLKV